jgi:anti-sigma factor ChrR (cupin superfamily)
MRHRESTDETRELASLYALGALEAKEARDFERHLADGCAVCARELESFRAVAGELGYFAPAAMPARDLKHDILEGVRSARAGTAASGTTQVWKQWKTDTAMPGFFTLRGDESGWDETDIPGISVRKLFVDQARDTVTMLVRMAPGTSYPPHRHAGVEECYVIEGDLKVGDMVMRAGDYQRVDTASVHGVQSTESGCTLFIISSLHDELMA